MLTSDQALMVLDHAADGLIVTDQRQPNHPIVYANAAFSRITGYHTADILGRNCRFLQNDDRDQSQIGAMRTAIGEGRAITVTLRNYRRDGSAFWNEVRLAPLDGSLGGTGYYIGFQRDVTSRVEDGIKLRHALTEATAANLLKARLLTAINHEFRTPIGIIAGFAELLLAADRRSQPAPPQSEYLHDIHAAAFHLLELVNDATAYMEATEAGPSPHSGPVRLSAVIDDAARHMDANVMAEGATLLTRPLAADAIVKVDPDRLRHALDRLIHELARRAPKGAVIEMDADPGPPASITVRCSALVLSAAMAEELLEPFGTGHPLYARGLEGARLSVAIAAIIVRSLGGKLLIDSDPASGTRFSVRLPPPTD